jgi:hypothetical protein
MLFCVNVIGIKAIHFSVIIFICKALDALNDTFIGQVKHLLALDYLAFNNSIKMIAYMLNLCN